MGMFDTVLIECKCGNILRKQSKAGSCLLNEYLSNKVPVEIAKDIDGSWLTCSNCGTGIKIMYPHQAPVFVSINFEYDFEEEA